MNWMYFGQRPDEGGVVCTDRSCDAPSPVREVVIDQLCADACIFGLLHLFVLLPIPSATRGLGKRRTLQPTGS
jgi:hypothetical protein